MSAPSPSTVPATPGAKKREPGNMVISAGILVIIVGLVMVLVSLLGGVVADVNSAPLNAAGGELDPGVVIARTWTLIGAALTLFGLLTMAVGYLRQINHRLGLALERG